jgi:HisA/HisF family protein
VRVIGVIDLKAGRAVHARGGKRDAYEPVRSPLLTPEQVGDAAALACAYRDLLGLGEIYVADLDAIDDPAAVRHDLRHVLAVGLPVRVDAGVATVRAAERVLENGATRAIVGLETLSSFEDLARIVRDVGRQRVVFSLDVRDGRPVTLPGASVEGEGRTPLEMAERAIQAGAGTVLLVDLGRVGRAVGADLDLVGALRSTCRSSELLVGGGVRNSADLERLDAMGCDGVLLGTALHGGMQVAKRWQRLRE